MGRPCGLCEHPERVAIEAALVDGTPYRQISSAHNLNVRTLSNHVRSHLQDVEPEPDPAAELQQATREWSSFCSALAKVIRDEHRLAGAAILQSLDEAGHRDMSQVICQRVGLPYVSTRIDGAWTPAFMTNEEIQSSIEETTAAWHKERASA